MVKNNFITKEKDFNNIVEKMSAIFFLERRLPAQVYKGFNQFKFIEFSRMFWREFWWVLQECAKRAGDSEIYLLLLDPQPVEYYYKNFRRYGALRFTKEEGFKQYINAFFTEPKESPADKFIANSFIWTWCGDSGKWGFYGERTRGIGIGATCLANFKWPQIENVIWFNIEDALQELVSLEYLKDLDAFKKFANKLRSNFNE